MGKMEACEISYYVRPEDFQGAQDIHHNTGDRYIKIKVSLNSLMTEFFEVSDIEELIQELIKYCLTARKVYTQLEDQSLMESVASKPTY